jgi:hypothetical protein
MTVVNTEKGELCTIELYLDEDYDERYGDGEVDFNWIDRFQAEQYDTIEDYIVEQLIKNEVKEKVFIDMQALRSSTIVLDSEYAGGYYIEEWGDSCMGGDVYVWDGNTLEKR